MANLTLTNSDLDAISPRLVLDKGTRPTGYKEVTEDVVSIIEAKTSRAWWIAFIVSFLTLIMLFGMLSYQVATGVGVWGNNSPVGWAWDITNFVFWIGIGHAGTLISAILFLFRQKWRTSINRAAEAMTLFAVACARHTLPT